MMYASLLLGVTKSKPRDIAALEDANEKMVIFCVL